MIRAAAFLAAFLLVPRCAWAEEETAANAKQSTIEFQGPLSKALRDIAAKGRINLVIAEPLTETVDIFLRDMSPDEALRSVAAAYRLQLDERKVGSKKSLWIVRRAAASEALVPPGPPSHPTSPPPPAPPAAPLPPPPPAPPSAQNDLGNELGENLDPRTRKKLQKLLKLKRRFSRPGDRDLAGTGPVHVEAGQTVEDAVSFGGPLVVDGEVTGDAVAFGGPLTVNGHVGGNCTAFGGQIHLGKDAVVNGKVQALGGGIVKDEGAVVEGGEESWGAANIGSLMARLPQHMRARSHGDSERTASRASRFLVSNFLLEFAVLFSIGFLALLFVPNRMKQLSSSIRADPIRCGLTGLVGFFAFIALFIMLCITLIGIPFALLLVPVFLLATAVGLAALAGEIGLRLPIFRGHKTQAIVLALGLLLLLIAWKVPWIGWIPFMVSASVGFGAIIRTRLGNRGNGFPEPIPPPAAT